MRYGKPTKNKRRIDPRYFLEETAERDEDLLTEKTSVMMPDGEEQELNPKSERFSARIDPATGKARPVSKRVLAARALWQEKNPDLRFSLTNTGAGVKVYTGIGGMDPEKSARLKKHALKGQSALDTFRSDKPQRSIDPDAGSGIEQSTQDRGEFYPDRGGTSFFGAASAGDEISPDVYAGGLDHEGMGGIFVDPEYEDEVSMPGMLRDVTPTSGVDGPRVQTDTDRAAHNTSSGGWRDQYKGLVKFKGKKGRPVIPKGSFALRRKANKLKRTNPEAHAKFIESDKYKKANAALTARKEWNQTKQAKGYYSKTKPKKSEFVTDPKKVAAEKSAMDAARRKLDTLRKDPDLPARKKADAKFQSGPGAVKVSRAKKPVTTPVPAPKEKPSPELQGAREAFGLKPV